MANSHSKDISIEHIVDPVVRKGKDQLAVTVEEEESAVFYDVKEGSDLEKKAMT